MRMSYTPSLNYTSSVHRSARLYPLLHKELQSLYPDEVLAYPRLPANLTIEEIFLWELTYILKADLSLERYLPALLPFPQQGAFKWDRICHILRANPPLFLYLKGHTQRLKSLSHFFDEAQVPLPL